MILDLIKKLLSFFIPSKKEVKAIETPDKIIEIPDIAFKEEYKERLEKEWQELDTQNPLLKEMLLDINEYSYRKFGKSIIITMLLRTQAEQDSLYWHDLKYRKKPWKSPHQFWQSADIRSSMFTSEEIKDLVEYINEKYDESNYWDWTAKFHNVGHGDHFHTQYLKV